MSRRIWLALVLCLILLVSASGLVWVKQALAAPSQGNTLIADTLNNRVIEVDAAGNIVWSFSTGLNYPRQVERLPNGNTLIADTKNNRAVEINRKGQVAWEYTSTTQVARSHPEMLNLV